MCANLGNVVLFRLLCLELHGTSRSDSLSILDEEEWNGNEQT
jgi:hypothetical protein